MATRTVGGGSGEGGGVGHGSGGVVSLHLFAGIKKSGRSVLPAHFLALLSLSRKSASALLPSTFHRYITVVLYSTEKERKSKAKKEEKRKKRKKEEKEEKEKRKKRKKEERRERKKRHFLRRPGFELWTFSL